MVLWLIILLVMGLLFAGYPNVNYLFASKMLVTNGINGLLASTTRMKKAPKLLDLKD